MKKFIIIVSTLVALYIFGDYAYYHLGWYVVLSRYDSGYIQRNYQYYESYLCGYGRF